MVGGDVNRSRVRFAGADEHVQGGEGCDRTNATTPCTGTGFPADVQATVVYTLTKDNQLKISYTAINGSKTLDTVINLTNHTYFNLGGEASGTVENQLLQINADQYTPVDPNLIPQSPFFVNVAGTAFDFRHLHAIGDNLRNTNLPDGYTPPAGQLKQLQIAHGYDHNWVLNGSGYRLVSTALDPRTGIVLWTFTDQPGVQFYSSNFQVGDLIGTSGHTSTARPRRSRWRPSTTPTRRTTSVRPAGRRWSSAPVRRSTPTRRTRSAWPAAVTTVTATIATSRLTY